MPAHQQRISLVLQQRLPKQNTIAAARLSEAMRYATLNGGKRLRAMLVYATGEAFNADPEALDAAACAVEMIHAYSLVHDDMPMMDDDDLRRGKPTCHKAYDEATALLVGDALQTLAFESLTDNNLPADQQIAMVKYLAHASGVMGMAGGQAIDLASVGKQLDQSELEAMHLLKTGALIKASVMLGVYCSSNYKPADLSHLDQYAAAIGLAFQVQDDVLDVIADTVTLGKQQGADIARNKPTYPALMGLKAAQQKAQALVDEALAALDNIDSQCLAMRALANFVVQRSF
ncbi:(2E,6E)-farnesyl diphosphate synthase [Methylophaga nitratireducenticrescens]|uniref:Polyprenyl synthetase n=1 Tax=Methylophaga nitratireducenticrescens TaxID=754476 RepID=I1XHZ2_METNJ|nr:farnesyl diphosphate synthase [Methylophaga nitratireducenticrescens]AFI84011.1 (2E,6E)-farnesyl diphosphate synthase [Methylophaga nitratireducenticrescens]AUZ86004.1 (2E,6E)-farnesyl diphosphate synthase [Methylophaga nitratireducenticrescens]